MAKSVYGETYARSMRDPEGFWAAAAEDINWEKRWDRVFDDSRKPFYRWFAGGELNTCYNTLDVHVDRGRGKQKALVYDSPVTGTVKAYTYRELRDAVALCAGMLRRQGIEKGDRVIVYMPMVPEAVIAMLACARIGAIHSVVFGGFASNELAKRIDDSQPKLVLSGSCGIEVNRVIPYKPLLDGAIDLARHKVPRCVILQRPQEAAAMVRGRDRDWHEEIAAAPRADGVPRDQEGRSAWHVHVEVRPREVPHAVPGGRALRSRHAPLGRGAADGSGRRSLVANRDGLADRRQLCWSRDATGEGGLADESGARLRGSRPRRRQP